METTANSSRIHPLMATAAVSLTLVSLVGAAAIAGLLPNSHGASTPLLTSEMMSGGSAQLLQQGAPAPVVREVVRYKTIVHHVYAKAQNVQYSGDSSKAASSDQRQDYRQSSAYQPTSQVAQNSPVGIGVGAVLGGLIGSHVGGGNGRTLAAIAGAVGGGYLGNEVAMHRLPAGQQ